MAKNDDQRELRCSFCGKMQNQVQRLIAGPGVCICNECVELCQSVLDDDAPPAPRARQNRQEQQIAVLKPHEIKEKLDEYVIGQERAKSRFLSRFITITSAFISAMSAMWS